MEALNEINEDFKSLGLNELICDVLFQIGYKSPTPIQRAAIPIGLQEKNIIAQAKAGTGKTLAFATVALSKALAQSDEKLSSLILLPTREIAIQVFDVMFQICEKILKKTKKEIRIGLCIGGLPIEDDRNFLRQKGHIVVGTLGRVLALINERSLDISNLKILILDEADKLSNAENYSSLKKIITFIPEGTQKLAFSATYTTNELEKLNTFMNNPEVIRIKQEAREKESLQTVKRKKADFEKETAEQRLEMSDERDEEGEMRLSQALDIDSGCGIDANPYKKVKINNDEKKSGNTCEEEHFSMNLRNLSQFFFNIDEDLEGKKNRASTHEAKFEKIIEVLKAIEFTQAIIFYNDKARGEEMVNDLKSEGFNVLFMHGNMTQAERIKVMNRLKIKRANIILSTDLLARGIDIEDISLVINYDVPRNTETYFHRIGRTGRFGRFGVSILMVTDNEKRAFIDENPTYIDIESLPDSWKEINAKLQEQREEKTKGDKKKEIFYGKESKISSWKNPEYQFFDDNKFQFYEGTENVPLGREEILQKMPEGKAKVSTPNKPSSKAESDNHADSLNENLEDEVDYYAFLDEEEGELINNEEKDKAEMGKADAQAERHLMTSHSHSDIERNDFQFLSCPVCYEFLKKSETLLGRKFKILEYFDIEN